MTTIAQENAFLFPEIVFGLAGAIGTDLDSVGDFLSTNLKRVGYAVEPIHLMEGLQAFEKWQDLPEAPLDERYRARMDAGDDFREELKLKQALALLGVAQISEIRRQNTAKICQEDNAQPEDQGLQEGNDIPLPRTAYILRSLKRPEEADALREIYGKNFVLIAAFSPRENRRKALARAIAKSRSSTLAECNALADELIERDEKDKEKKFGQNLSDAFSRADFFVNADDRKNLHAQIARVVELIFGNVFITPSQDEYGMFHAWAASLRSASLARQVGAAICSEDGEVLSLGCNEVPKAGGGQYWPSDKLDSRDHILGSDSNDDLKLLIFADVLKRVKESGWLCPGQAEKDESQLLREALSEDKPLSKSIVLDITEFGRAVHAELAAMMSALRLGVSTQGATLYCTTFPCHNCAKHIVTAGIKRVVYVEPYPKSRALELHDDSIKLGPDKHSTDLVCFEPFVGVSPRQYFDVFSLGLLDRKSDACVVEWDPNKSIPRLRTSPLAYMRREADALSNYQTQISSKNLHIITPEIKITPQL